MSKLISLGLLALLLSLLAAPVIAESGEECVVLKGVASPGLHGLCLAYHNARSPDAMQKFLDKYNERKGPDDPVMPGTEEIADCLCWTMDQMALAHTLASAHSCQVDSDPEFAIYGTDSGAIVTFLVNVGICFYVDPIFMDFLFLNEEEEQNCRDAIHGIVIGEDFKDIITCT